MVHKAFIPTEVVSISFIKHNTNGICGSKTITMRSNEKAMPKAQHTQGIYCFYSQQLSKQKLQQAMKSWSSLSILAARATLFLYMGLLE